jgi:CRISP-associated protein Cas1
MVRTRIVELAENGRVLKHFRGFLVVEQNSQEIGRVPWDDIAAILLTAPDIMLTKYALMTASEQNIPVIIMGKNYHPLSILTPLSDHGESKLMLELQIEATAPLLKNCWQKLIHKKIYGQAYVLGCFANAPQIVQKLQDLSNSVKSGDSGNLEAICASDYWRHLFDTPFKRYQEGGGFNNLLNYAYAIMRATLARAVIASGLNPALGIHHKNKRNPFCLVDDLIEPFRPLIDAYLLQHKNILTDELTPADKKILAKIPTLAIRNHDNELSSITQTATEIAQSYARSLREKKCCLRLPNFPPTDFKILEGEE